MEKKPFLSYKSNKTIDEQETEQLFWQKSWHFDWQPSLFWGIPEFNAS